MTHRSSPTVPLSPSSVADQPSPSANQCVAPSSSSFSLPRPSSSSASLPCCCHRLHHLHRYRHPPCLSTVASISIIDLCRRLQLPPSSSLLVIDTRNANWRSPPTLFPRALARDRERRRRYGLLDLFAPQPESERNRVKSFVDWIQFSDLNPTRSLLIGQD